MPALYTRRLLTPSRSTALAALTACVVLFTLLGHKPLTDWDEGIYAEVSREMLTRGWPIPHWNTQPWLEKPPLMLWLTAVFFRLFGVSEFWARAGSALSGVAVVALTHAWVLRIHRTLAAWLASLILLGTFGFLHVAHVGEMDVLLSLGCLIAVLGLERVTALVASGWYLFWGGCAIAAMTKGAAAVVIPVTAIILLASRPRALLRFAPQFAAGLLLFFVVVLPWHLAMLHAFGGRFLQEYFGLHVFARATEQIEGHSTHWWYYGKVLLVSAPPFCLLYPFAFARGLRCERLRPLAVFAAVVVVFFTVVQTRLPHYIAPAYPALSILTGVWLADIIARLRTEKISRRSWGALITCAVLITAASILVTAKGRSSLHSATLANGTVLASNKEATALLRRNLQALTNIPGPLLVWRESHPPIVTDVFYSRRPVQQIELDAPAPGSQTDRYTFDPVALASAVPDHPVLLLVDAALITRLPPGFVFTPMDHEGPVALGWITRREQALLPPTR